MEISFLHTPDYSDIANLISIFMRKHETYDTHGPNVANMAMKLAAATGMAQPEVKLVGIGAQLHDIGKILVRSDVVNATRKLNTIERGEMQMHVKIGWEIVSDAGYEPMIQDVVKYHHEKWDGSGYAFGLRGEQIPLTARIVSVCDVYEAMTNERSYRKAYTHDFVRNYMHSRKGSDFDPRLVNLFFQDVAAGPQQSSG